MLGWTFVIAAIAAGPQDALPTQPGATIDAYLAPYVACKDFSGVVAVKRGGELLYRKSFGHANFADGSPMPGAAAFHIASLSKTFTAAAIRMLEMQGRLALTDPLSKYLPLFPGGDKITIEHLLSHRAGLAEYQQLPDVTARIQTITLNELVQQIGKAPRLFEPGSEHRYTNSNYTVLAHVVEAVTRLSFVYFVRESIILPLELASTGDLATIHPPHLLYGYEPAPGPQRIAKVTPTSWVHATGSGSMYSTVDDLLRWLAAIDAHNIIDVFSWPYPYGWGKRTYHGKEAIEQTGMHDGFFATMILFPQEHLYIVCLSNIQSGEPFARMNRDLAAIVFGAPYEMPVCKPEVELGADTARLAVGKYRFGDGKSGFTISREDSGLYWQWDDATQKRYLTPIGETSFLFRTAGSEIQFIEPGPKGFAALEWISGKSKTRCMRVE